MCFIEMFEYARAEYLACGEFPGLRKLCCEVRQTASVRYAVDRCGPVGHACDRNPPDYRSEVRALNENAAADAPQWETLPAVLRPRRLGHRCISANGKNIDARII